MESPITLNRNEKLSRIRSAIKVMPIITSNRDALQSKAEKRRKRRQSIAVSPHDVNAMEQDKISLQQLQSCTKKQVFLQKYEILQKVGQGSNGVVRKCRHKQKDKIYAVKCMEFDEEHCLFLKKNFRYIRDLDHPNIINYRSLFLDLHKRRTYLVMDYITMPSLEKAHNLSQQDMRQIMKQIILTLQYIHSKNICHRDIKPDNILYDKQTKKIKIIDFGISKKTVERYQKNQFLTITGTLYYRAPEMFLGSGYDQSVDMWAAGITLYKLIMKRTPFQSEYLTDTIQNISKNSPDFTDSIWNFYSPFVKDLISRLLVKNKKQRLTAKQAKKHFWFQQKLTSSSEGMLTHSDSFQFQFKKRLTKKPQIDDRNIQQLRRKNSQFVHNEDSLEMAKYKMKRWMIDSDDDDVLIEINSQGEQVMTPKTGKKEAKQNQQTPSSINQ